MVVVGLEVATQPHRSRPDPMGAPSPEPKVVQRQSDYRLRGEEEKPTKANPTRALVSKLYYMK